MKKIAHTIIIIGAIVVIYQTTCCSPSESKCSSIIQNNSDTIYCNEILGASRGCFSYNNTKYKDDILIAYLKNKQASIECHQSNIWTQFKSIESVEDKVFLAFAEFPVVNGWYDDPYGGGVFKTKKENIEYLVKEHDLHYCGQVHLSDTFKSFLFSMTFSCEANGFISIDSTVFLINAKQDTITSVSQIYENWIFEGYLVDGYISNYQDYYKFYSMQVFEDSMVQDSMYFDFDVSGRVCICQ